MSLNPRQKRFAEAYHRCGNATRAYGEAYDIAKTDGGNYPGWCAVEGHRLLRNPKIQEELEKLRGEASKLSAMTLEELTDFLSSALTTPVEEIGIDSPLCQEYRIDKEGNMVVKSIPKIPAAQLLARLCGWEKERKIDLGVDDALAKLLGEIRDTR